jgi:hypothetical protein
VGTEGLPDPVRDRLAEHVASIIGRSIIPAGDREDVAEELLGHLEMRYVEAISTGLSGDEAASKAIAGFGGADVIGREFMDTYHGRLWASTIGQLLPVASAGGQMPGAVLWTARFDRFIALFNIGAAAVWLVTASPVKAAVGASLLVVGATILWLAATGLQRGQSWAVRASLIALLANAVQFFLSLGQPPGGWTVSINGLIGLVLLIAMVASSIAVDQWVAGSKPIRRRLGVPLALGLISWALLPVLPSVADPTQIGPADIDAIASVSCAVAPSDDGVPRIPSPTVVLAVAYHRVDLAPRGIWRDPSSWGDMIEAAVQSGGVEFGIVTATMTDGSGQTDPVDVSNIVEPDLGSTQFNDGPIFGIDNENGQLVVGEILGADQRAGRTIKITIPTVTNIGDGRPAAEIGTPVDGMYAQVRLSHLGRFVLVANVPCGGQAKLIQDGAP